MEDTARDMVSGFGPFQLKHPARALGVTHDAHGNVLCRTGGGPPVDRWWTLVDAGGRWWTVVEDPSGPCRGSSDYGDRPEAAWAAMRARNGLVEPGLENRRWTAGGPPVDAGGRWWTLVDGGGRPQRALQRLERLW
eukprot:scaffold939_cov181-Pinguiococcus_pyrenoidosus.AAC.1